MIPYTALLRRQFQRAVALGWPICWAPARVAPGPRVLVDFARLGLLARAIMSPDPARPFPIGFDNDADYLGWRGGGCSSGSWRSRGRCPAGGRRAVPLPHALASAPCRTWRYVGLEPDLPAGAAGSAGGVARSALLRPGAMRRNDACRRRCGGSSAARLAGREALRLSGPGWLSSVVGPMPARPAICGQLRELFPQVEIQPKGLLATEGCVSFPLTRRPAPVLAVRSHFFEFQEIDAPERLRLAHESTAAAAIASSSPRRAGSIATNCATRSRSSVSRTSVRCCGS